MITRTNLDSFIKDIHYKYEIGLTSVSDVTKADVEVLSKVGFETFADLREAACEAIFEPLEIPDQLTLRIKPEFG